MVDTSVVTSTSLGPLWANAALPPTVSLRSRSFWWQLYMLEHARDESPNPAGFGAHPDVRTTSDMISINMSVELRLSLPGSAALVFSVGAGGVGLHLRDEHGSNLLGWLSASNPMPHVFRWTEVEAIATALERGLGLPSDPSLVRLLLAPFAVVSPDEDQDSVALLLGEHLDRLGLLTFAEVETVKALVIQHPDSDGQFPRWSEDPTLGWALTGTTERGGINVPLYQSLRQADQTKFPAQSFVKALNACGVADLNVLEESETVVVGS